MQRAAPHSRTLQGFLPEQRDEHTWVHSAQHRTLPERNGHPSGAPSNGGPSQAAAANSWASVLVREQSNAPYLVGRSAPRDSRFLLRPHPEVWQAYMERKQQAILAGIPQNTKASNDGNWRFWVEHCARWDTTPIRNDFPSMSGADPVGFRDEVDLAASFVDARYVTMEPRTKGTHPKPSSAFDSYLAVQRVLDLQSIPRLPMREIRSMVKGLAKQYIDEHGLEAILPHRKQPFSNRQQERLVNAIPNGAKVGKFRYLRDSYFGDTWDALNKVLEVSGFRKAEWAVAARGLKTHMTFAQIAYAFDKDSPIVRRPSRAQLQMRTGYVYLYPVPSKCDPDGSIFCTKAIPLRLDDPNGPGVAIMRLERRLYEQGVSNELRKTRPIFATQEGEPFTAAEMDAVLSDALRLTDPSYDGVAHSWHSYRIRLACKLRAAKMDDHTIQACLRWRTAKALDVYARFEAEFYDSILRDAAREDATSVSLTSLPEVDPDERIHKMSRESDELVPEHAVTQDLVAPVQSNSSTLPSLYAIVPKAQGSSSAEGSQQRKRKGPSLPPFGVHEVLRHVVESSALDSHVVESSALDSLHS